MFIGGASFAVRALTAQRAFRGYNRPERASVTVHWLVELPPRNLQSRKTPEVHLVERDDGQIKDVSNRGDLTISERRCFTLRDKTCSFAGMPFGRRAVIAEDRYCREDHFVQVSFDDFASA